MEASKVWPQWVHRLKAYTITKSRREKVRRERLRAVVVFMDYTIGVRSAQPKEWKETYKSTLENDFNISDVDSLCLSIIRERKKKEDWEEFCFARKIINTIFYYNEARPDDYMACKIQIAFIRMHIDDAQKSYGGAIARRTFKEIETKLIEASNSRLGV